MRRQQERDPDNANQLLGDAGAAGRLLRRRLGEERHRHRRRRRRSRSSRASPSRTSRRAWTPRPRSATTRSRRSPAGGVNPDAFTHGTSAQRQQWFRTGLRHRRPEASATRSATASRTARGRHRRRGLRRERLPADPPGASVDDDPQVVRRRWRRPGPTSVAVTVAPLGAGRLDLSSIRNSSPPAGRRCWRRSRRARPRSRVSLQSWSYAPAMLPAASRARNASAASRAAGAGSRARGRGRSRRPEAGDEQHERQHADPHAGWIVDRSSAATTGG